MILAVDFDGTLCRGRFPAIDGEQPYATETMKQLKADGHYLIIWTCRTGEPLLKAINWLLEQGIPFDRVNDHNPDNVKMYGDAGKKVYAHAYIDDKNLEGFPGWQEAYRIINEKEKEYVQSKS